MQIPIKIAGTGRYLPKRVVPFDEIAELCSVSPDWMAQHTGVLERRWATEEAGETNAWMAAKAAEEAIAAAGLETSDVDCLIYASATVQQLIPDTSVYVLQELGIGDAGIECLSVHATCLSFVGAMDAAANRLAAGRNRCIVVVSSEITSIGLNFKDPESAGLFGDGAAAVVLTMAQPGETSCLQSVHFETYASAAQYTTFQGGGTRKAPNDPRTKPEDNQFAMDGHEVLRFTLRKAPRFLSRLLAETSMDEIDCIIPHQTSKAGLDAMTRLGMTEDKTVRTLPSLGNCVAASIPMALYQAVNDKRIARGDKLLLIGTSAGLTLGGMILTY